MTRNCYYLSYPYIKSCNFIIVLVLTLYCIVRILSRISLIDFFQSFVGMFKFIVGISWSVNISDQGFVNTIEGNIVVLVTIKQFGK